MRKDESCVECGSIKRLKVNNVYYCLPQFEWKRLAISQKSLGIIENSNLLLIGYVLCRLCKFENAC